MNKKLNQVEQNKNDFSNIDMASLQNLLSANKGNNENSFPQKDNTIDLLKQQPSQNVLNTDTQQNKPETKYDNKDIGMSLSEIEKQISMLKHLSIKS